MSTGSLAPSSALFPSTRIAHGTGVAASGPSLGADPDLATRFQRRVIADIALAELERAVNRLHRRLDPGPYPAVSVSRRSHRSAWWSID